MEEDTPITKRPWFYIAVWVGVLLVLYGIQIFRMGGLRASLLSIAFDLIILFPALLLLWMAFFAQFVLPVFTRADRKKIFDHLRANFFGGHGPAMFIKNGELIKGEDEEMKKGVGVLWLDSSSAAVTRTPVRIKQTLGPGVHFIDSGEYIAGIVDLHRQRQTIGPKADDDIFGTDEGAEFDEFAEERRKMVSALTRDGIEVVPTISITFRVDTGFPADNEPGSRFGYRTGITKKARENEEKDKDAIRKAILGESINPNVIDDTVRRRVAWNELPASLAVDVWREYASKFTLDQLFKQDQPVPPTPPSLPQPTAEEIDFLSQPIRVAANQSSLQDYYAIFIRKINQRLFRAIQKMENPQPVKKEETPPPVIDFPKSTPPAKTEAARKTGLQVINELVNARLTKPDVPYLDDHGNRGQGLIESPEYQLLQDRGLQVVSVGISNLRFHPVIEETIISRWSANWFDNAKAESKQIERRQNLVKSAGQDKAILQYADLLSLDLIRKKPYGVNETLKTLIMRTRNIIINNDQLRKDMSHEQQELEDILRWIEESE